MLRRNRRAQLLILLSALVTPEARAQTGTQKQIEDRQVTVNSILATRPLWMVFVQEDGRVGSTEPRESDFESASWLLWSLLADGSTAYSGPYREPIRRIERWLLRQQDSRGRFGHSADPQWSVHHARVAAALASDAARTGHSQLAHAAEAASGDLLRLIDGLGDRVSDELLFWSWLLADRLIATQWEIATSRASCPTQTWVSSGRELRGRLEGILDQRATASDWTPITALLETLRQRKRFSSRPDDRAIEAFTIGTTAERFATPLDSLSDLAAVIGLHGHREDDRLASLWTDRESSALRLLLRSYNDHPLADHWLEGDPQPQVPGNAAELVRGFAIQALAMTEYYRYSRFPASSFAD